MSRQWRLIPFVLCIAAAGCITSFTHPLGPAGQAYIDERLLGTWKCVSTDDESSGDLILVKFDSSQYLLRMVDRGSAQDYRALATRLGESSFISMRAIGPKAEGGWTILQYTFTDVGDLTLRGLDPNAFEDVVDEPQAVRDRLEARVEDPEILVDVLQCTRGDRAHPPNEGEEERTTAAASAKQ